MVNVFIHLPMIEYIPRNRNLNRHYISPKQLSLIVPIKTKGSNQIWRRRVI